MARLAERLGGFPAFRDSAAPETLGCLRDHALQDWRDVVRRFPLPLLMLAGRESQVWSCEHADAAVAGTAHGRALVIEDAGHAISIDQPDLFNQLLLDFLAEVGAARPMRLVPPRAHGDGPRQVALVHGLGADGALWRGLTERLVAAGGATVTTVDLRGHGASDRSDDYGVDAFADDLVETLPTGLDLVVGHSLGGTVLERAVGRLAPAHALYLDPGFRLSIPSEGLAGRLFWATAPVGLIVAGLAQKWRSRGVVPRRPRRTPPCAWLRSSRFDKADGDRRLPRHRPPPRAVAAPAVPSTIVLSDDSPAVLPDEMADGLAALGWDVRRLPGVGHDFWLEDPDRTTEVVRDLLLGEHTPR